MAQPQPPPPPPPSGGTAPQRPQAVTTAAVLLLVIGILRGLLMLLVLTALLDIAGDAGVNGALFALALILTLLTLVAGILQIMGGRGALRTTRRGYSLAFTGTLIGAGARIADLVVSASLDIALGGAYGVLSFLLLATDAIIISLLVRNKEAFTN